MGKVITEPKLLLVEGKDEVKFFTQLVSDLDLVGIQVRAVGGKARFRDRLNALLKGPGHDRVTSLGIVRDADKNPQGAFDSICGALRALGLPIPPAPLQPVGDSPQITVMILPDKDSEGMLEDLCLASVVGDPAMACVEAYFACLEDQIDLDDLPNNPAKARMRAFLSAMEWCEEAYFESLQEHLRIHPPENPTVAQVHTILSSRYKPDLDLGIAAQKGYWPLDDPIFADVKQFLRSL
jgi:hypothetical protein